MGITRRVMGGLAGICVVVAAGCADDPRPGRRATAIDVAGAWREVRETGSAARLQLDQEEGINDVVATLLERTVAGAEADALARVSSPEERAALAQLITLGAGRDVVREETDGGENVSFDGGLTTTVQVRSAPVPVLPSSSRARAATLAWALRLDGDDVVLAGTLAVLVSEVVPRPGDPNGVARQTTRVEVPLRFERAPEE